MIDDEKFQEDMRDMRNQQAYVTLRQTMLEEKLNALSDDVKEIRETLKGQYVTQDQFAPVKAIIYGLVSLILVSVVGALVMIVVKR